MVKLIWHTEKRKVKELISWDKNPRRLTKKQFSDLKKSLEKFNLMSIPVITNDDLLISGHQRIKVLKALKRGENEIDVRVPNRDLTDEELSEANIRENKNLGSWDFDMLANNFDIDMLEDVGFTDAEFKIDFESSAGDSSELDIIPVLQVLVECESKEEQEDVCNLLTDNSYKAKIISR